MNSIVYDMIGKYPEWEYSDLVNGLWKRENPKCFIEEYLDKVVIQYKRERYTLWKYDRDDMYAVWLCIRDVNKFIVYMHNKEINAALDKLG